MNAMTKGKGLAGHAAWIKRAQQSVEYKARAAARRQQIKNEWCDCQMRIFEQGYEAGYRARKGRAR